MVQNYASCKASLNTLKIKLIMLKLTEIRAKVQVKTAQKYMDARLQIINNIMTTKLAQIENLEITHSNSNSSYNSV